MPPPIPQNDLDRIHAWINEFVPPTDTGLSPAALEAQRRNTASFDIPDAPVAPTARRQDFDDRTVTRLVTELWREALIGSGISQDSDIANSLFLYIARGINESGRVSGGDILPEDVAGATRLELNAFDILRQRETDVDSFPSSGVSGHKLPLKGMLKGALARGLLEAGRISQQVFNLLGDPIIGGGGAFSPVEREAAAVQRTLERDFGELLDASRAAPGAGTAGLRQAFTNVLTSETPGEIASGNSVFKFEQPGVVSGEDIDSFLKDKDTFVSDLINRLNPNFNPSTTVDKDRTSTLSQAHIREKARINSLFDELVRDQVDPADAASQLIQGLEAFTENDFQETIQGVQQEEEGIEAQKRVEDPSIRKKELENFLINNGVDLKSILPEHLTALALGMPPTGIDQDFANQIMNAIPPLQQQKVNVEAGEEIAKGNQAFVGATPARRQADIASRVGFDGPLTFGAQEQGQRFQTPFDIDRQTAFANAAVPVIESDIRENRFIDIDFNVQELQRTRDAQRRFGPEPPGFGENEFFENTIAGFNPPVEGSLTQRQQAERDFPFPGPGGSAGIAGLPRGRTGLDLVFPQEGEFGGLARELSGGDLDFEQSLRGTLTSPGFRNRFATAGRESRALDVEANRSNPRSTPGTTDVTRFRFDRFATRFAPRLRQEFEDLPSTVRLREQQRRRRLSRGSGQAIFRPFGNRRL